jgi:FAD/FMN-containing dehydrogenase
MSALMTQLASIVGDPHVLSGEAIADRATSYWNASPIQTIAIVKPASTEEVSQVLSFCHQQGQSVVIQSGGTGVCEGADPSLKDVVISLERMNRIIHVDQNEMVATVEAGVILQNLQETLADEGLLFPLDLGARGSCMIGGNVATNAGGINVLRYGMVRNLVLGLEVVLMDGTVLSSMYPMLKNNTGYDLKQLFIGSEGTLGVITKVMVRLFPLPTSCQTAMVAVDSFKAVSSVLNQFRAQLSGTLSAFEVMWNNYYVGVTGEGKHRAPLARDYPFYIIIEAEGFDDESDRLRFEGLLSGIMEGGQILDAVLASSERERREIWMVREEFDALLPAYLYDVSLPLGAMNEYAEVLKERFKAELPGCHPVLFGHIADGNLHIFAGPYVDEAHHASADQIVYSALVPFDGSVSAEHGIGLNKKAWLSQNRSEDELALMRSIKQVLDPQHLLNPGRII